jgi:hypothetical protein
MTLIPIVHLGFTIYSFRKREIFGAKQLVYVRLHQIVSLLIVLIWWIWVVLAFNGLDSNGVMLIIISSGLSCENMAIILSKIIASKADSSS